MQKIDNREDLQSALEEVFEGTKLQSLATDESASHGFSTQLISDVVKNCNGTFTIECVFPYFPVFSLEVIQEIFLDIPSLEDTLQAIW